MNTREVFWMKLKRIIRTGFFNFWRNSTVSLASVLVMTVTLLSIGFLSFFNTILATSLLNLQNKIDINVTFITGAEDRDILNIKHSLESLPEPEPGPEIRSRFHHNFLGYL